MWEQIIDGLLCDLRGDGLELFDKKYGNKGEYHNAFKKFDDVINQIHDKDSLLFLFVERERITTLALSFEKSIDEIIVLFDNLISHFNDSENLSIQIQIARAMLDKSFVLYKYFEQNNDKDLFQKSLFVQEDLINKFKSHKSVDIQRVITVCLNNKATDLEIISEQYNRDQEKIWDEIISNYKDIDNNAIQIQVSKAMWKKAFSLNIKYIVEEAKQQKGVSIPQDNNYAEQALNGYDEFINRYKLSNVLKIQQDVAMVMGLKGKLLLQQGKVEDAIEIYTDLIDTYCSSQDELIMNSVFWTFAEKGSLLFQQANENQDINNLNLGIKAYTDCLNIFKNTQNKYITHFHIAFFMLKRANMLSNLNNIEETQKAYQEIVDFFNLNEDERVQSIVHSAKEQVESIENYLKNEQEKIQWQKHLDELSVRMNEIINYSTRNKRHIEMLLKSIVEHKVIPCIGAGLSKFAEYPLWEEFLKKVYENPDNGLQTEILEENFINMSCKDKASAIQEKLGHGIFADEIRSHFASKQIPLDTLADQSIWFLPDLFKKQVLFTTNFDNLIQKVYENKNIHIQSCTSEYIEALKKRSGDATFLYQIHGTVESYKNVILTREDYDKHYGKSTDNYTILNSCMQGKDILFLGCGLKEDDEILELCTSKNTTSYAIYACEENEVKSIQNKLSNKGILAILYPPKDDHSYLSTILEYFHLCYYQHENRNNMNRALSRDGGMPMQQLITQAKGLQEKVAQAQQQLEEERIQGISDDEYVTITMTGKYDITEIKLSDSIDSCSKENMEKSILSALQNAKEQADATIDNVMSEATKGMPKIEAIVTIGME